MNIGQLLQISFYVLAAVVLIVIFIPAMYSLFGKKKTPPNIQNTRQRVMPQNFQVTNQQWTSSQSEHIPHHVTHVQIPQTESKPTTQRPRPGKFEVFNDLNSKSGSEVKTKSWNSQWQ